MQAGPNADLLGRQFDTGKFMNQMGSFINNYSKNLPTKEGQYLRAGQLGKNFGLSIETSQALLKYYRGELGSGDKNKLFDNIKKEMAQTNMWSKDLNELLKQLVMGVLAPLLMNIYDTLKSIWKVFGGGASKADQFQEASQRGGMGTIQEQIGEYSLKPQAALGATIQRTGLIMAHAQEEIVSAPNVQKFKNGTGSNGINVNINVNMEQNLKQAFDQAYQKTLRAIKKSNNYAYGIS